MDPHFQAWSNLYPLGENWNPPTQPTIVSNNPHSGTPSLLTNIRLPQLIALSCIESPENPARRTNEAAIRANNLTINVNYHPSIDYHPQVVVQTSPVERGGQNQKLPRQYSFIPPEPRVKKKRSATKLDTSQLDTSQFVCFVCFEQGAEKKWRSGPQGDNTLCNGCGVEYGKNIFRLRNEDIKHIPLQFYAKPEGVQSIEGLNESPEFLRSIKKYFDETKFKELASLAEKYKSIKRSSGGPQKTEKVEINANHIKAYIQRARTLCSLKDEANETSSGRRGTKCHAVKIGKYEGTTIEDKKEKLPKKLASDIAAIEAYVNCFTWERDFYTIEEQHNYNKKQLDLLGDEPSKKPPAKRQKIDLNDILNPTEEGSSMIQDQIAPTGETIVTQTQPRRDKRLEIAFILNSPNDD